VSRLGPALALLLLLACPAGAQGLRGAFSPGDLSTPHLDDAGEPLACEECHAAGDFVQADRCLTCHEEIAALRERPTTFHGRQTAVCATCHAEHRGRDAQLVTFDHDAFDHDLTGFALAMGHADLRCSACHEPGTWLGAKQTCAECHDAPHGERLLRPELTSDCADCHDVTRFSLGEAAKSFDHGDPAHTRFPIADRHAELKCSACHPDARFAPTDHADCASCHEDPHRRADGACADCHAGSVDWTVDRLAHARLGFALRGLHASAPCTSCHTGPSTLDLVPHAACGTCHEDPHAGAFGDRDCGACHDTQAPAFAPRDFDHQAAWPLLGAHGAASCDGCHGLPEDRTWTGIATDTCGSCHQDQGHGERFADDCASCHDERSWTETHDFDADTHALTGFTLEGGHRVECASCHTEGTRPPPDPTCTSCHEDPHAARFPVTTCLDCHPVDAPWRGGVTFDHGTTDFALTGGHEGQRCRSCHDGLGFQQTKTACRDCHAGAAPRHHFPQACDRCHTVVSWPGAVLDATAHASLGFVLEGRHAHAACADCHPDGDDASPLCHSCHAGDDPHRNQLGDDCASCHRPTAWERSRFRHSQVGWPLRSEHALAECDDCHAAGFVGTPRDCDACHVGATWP